MSRMINILKKKIVPSLFVEEETQAGSPVGLKPEK